MTENLLQAPFAPGPENNVAPDSMPSENLALSASDRLITLTIGQLQILISQAVTKANQPLQDRIEFLETKRMQELEEVVAANHRYACRRLSSLEEKDAKPSAKTDNYLKILADHLQNISQHGQAGITYKQAAKLLKISKERVCQMRTQISSDPRLNISWHPSKKNTKIISLKKNNIRGIV